MDESPTARPMASAIGNFRFLLAVFGSLPTLSNKCYRVTDILIVESFSDDAGFCFGVDHQVRQDKQTASAYSCGGYARLWSPTNQLGD